MVLLCVCEVGAFQAQVVRDKALLTFAIVKGYKFNVGKVIENLILKSAYHKEITHPSLITKLCELTKVPIRENEEKCPPMQSLHFSLNKAWLGVTV